MPNADVATEAEDASYVAGDVIMVDVSRFAAAAVDSALPALRCFEPCERLKRHAVLAPEVDASLRRLLGHSRIETTAGMYDHTTGRDYGHLLG